MSRLRDWLRLPRRQKPKAWLNAEEDALVPPRSLWIGPDDPINHYYRWVWEYLAYLTILVDLRRTDSVLELGCGHGRTARGLLEYIRSPGRYVGLDVDRARVADAQQRIQHRWPNFTFVWADVFNRHYNPAGTVPGELYRFPFDAESFDVVYGASLFTHLLPAEVQNYLHECRRVLKPGGRCLFSVFLLDRYRGKGTSVTPMYEFEHRLPGHEGVAVRDPDHPDHAVGYSLATLQRMAADASLTFARDIAGLWSVPETWAVNEHDLIVLRRE